MYGYGNPKKIKKKRKKKKCCFKTTGCVLKGFQF